MLKKETKLKMNLQLFAESSEGEEAETQENQQNQDTQENKDSKQEGQKFFSQDELNDVLEKRLARERKKMQEDFEKQQRLAQMTAEERKAEENKELLDELKNYKAEVERNKLKDYASTELTNYGVDTKFSKYLVGKDNEETLLNIKEFKSDWDRALKSAVDKALQGSTPKQPQTTEQKAGDSFLAEINKYI